jgi:predicted SnoaL-like aldol condensation-catalyzing enzyme
MRAPGRISRAAWRSVENEKLAEHWDVVLAKPDTLPHGNGLF